MKLTKIDKILAGTALVVLMGFARYSIWLHSEEFRIGQYELKSQWANKNGTKDAWVITIKPNGQYIRQEYWGRKWASAQKPNPKRGPRNLTYTFNPDGTFIRHFKGTYVAAGTNLTFIEDSGPNSFPRFTVRTGHITRHGLVLFRHFSVARVARIEDIESGKILHDSGVKEQLFVKIE